MKENLIIKFHIGGLSGNFGVDKNKSYVEEDYYWLGMTKEVKIWVALYNLSTCKR